MKNTLHDTVTAEKRPTMLPIHSKAPSRAIHCLAIVTVMTAAGLLQGCGTRDNMSTGAIPDDYRTRHPISLTEAEHTLDIPVASDDSRMTIGMRDAVRGFVADYRTRASGTLQIQFPRGSMNEGAVTHMRKELRALLAQSGVPSPKIVETTYTAAASGDAAPVRLSYVGITAVTNRCGQWPEDIANNTIENRNWHNFGCASQNNLAAQIANPMDLVAPRAMSLIDAQQRSNVIKTYREAPSRGR